MHAASLLLTAAASEQLTGIGIRLTRVLTASEWATVIQAAASVGALAAIAVGVFQLRETRRVSVIQNTVTSIDVAERDKLYAAAKEALRKELGIEHDEDRRLTAEDAARILGNAPAKKAVFDYLNWWERVSACLNLNAFDHALCSRRFGGMLVGAYESFEPLILARQNKYKRAYIELQERARSWRSTPRYRRDGQLVVVDLTHARQGTDRGQGTAE